MSYRSRKHVIAVFVSIFLLTFSLKVYSCMDPDQDPIAIINQNPTFICPDTLVAFDGLSSYDQDEGGSAIVGYNWDYSSFSSVVDDPCGESRSHFYCRFNTADHYELKLTVTDDESNTAYSTSNVYVVDLDRLEPDLGDEIDDGDGNSLTREWYIGTGEGVVTVEAITDPAGVSVGNLPACWPWQLAGGNVTDALHSTIDRTVPGTTVITCSADGRDTHTCTVHVQLGQCYVSPDGDDNNPGTQAEPFATIQHGIDMVSNGGTVYVEPGTYQGSGNRDISFIGKEITVINQALTDPVISGDAVVDCQDAARGFIFDQGETENSVLNGFIIMNGNNSDGGGMYIESSPTIINCTIVDNEGGSYGGGIKFAGGTPLISNCIIQNNSANNGGGVQIGGSSVPAIKNCVLKNNTALSEGGAISFEKADELEEVDIINCTIYGNSASTGGALHNKYGGEILLQNCILWNNTASVTGSEIHNVYANGTTLDFCVIEGGFNGDKCSGEDSSGNIGDNFGYDPLFWADGFHLRPQSPCIDSVDPSYTPDAGETDIDGDARLIGAAVDIGADEYHIVPPTNLEATALTDGRVSLDWDDNSESDLDYYKVYRSTTSGNYGTAIDTVLALDGSVYVDASVSLGVTYYYVVTAVSTSSYESGYSNETNVVPVDTAPTAPTGLVAAGGDSTISLDWDDNSETDIDHYKVYRSTTSGSGYVLVDGNVVDSDYNNGSLNNYTTYYYVVKAVDGIGQESDFSNEAIATPMDKNPPSKPTGLNSVIGDYSVSLSWDTSADTDVIGYNIYRTTLSGDRYMKIGHKDGIGSTSYLDNEISNLSQNITYYYVVTAVDGTFESEKSDEISVKIVYGVYNKKQGKWYKNIQHGIDNADDEDVIRIPSSDTAYQENLVFNKPVTLISDNPSNPAATVLDGNGGVVLTFGADSATSQVIGIKIIGGTAGNGGGIYSGGGATPKISHCIIQNNTATNQGGGVYVADGVLELSNCDIIDNEATINGGGVYVAGGKLRLIDCDILNNVATVDGGGIYIAGGEVDISGCILEDNSAVQGGAIAGTGGTLTSTDCDLISNNSSGNGGAIYSNNLQINVENCSFEENTASGNGSAIYGGSGKVVCSEFFGNSIGVGASVAIDSTVDFWGCVFNSNILSDNAPALQDCSGDIINCTITENSVGVDTNGLFHCTGLISNCVIYGNGDGTTAPELDGTCSAPSYCCIRNWSGPGNNNISPASTPVEADGYHLQAGSVCIDAGDDSVVPDELTEDIDEGRRIFSMQVDMGADEAGKIIYVHAGAEVGGDGLSWATAYKYLQDALYSGSLSAGDEIWVAQGTYYPDEGSGRTNDARTETFQLVAGVVIYGGFCGDEVELEERDLANYQTILSGDIEGWVPSANNCYHVVTANDNTVLDGFLIVGGVADDSSLGGGGMLINNKDDVTVRNCYFSRNNASDTKHGGGMYIVNSGTTENPITLVNCLFAGNTAAKFINFDINGCELHLSYGDGGGIYNSNSCLTLINCTLSDNLADNGGGLYSTGTSEIYIDNSILWNNRGINGGVTEAQLRIDGGSATVNYSCIQDEEIDDGNVYSGTGNTDLRPEFVQPGVWEGVVLPNSISLMATIRDFKAGWNKDSGYERIPEGHPDFERENGTCADCYTHGIDYDFVNSILGVDGKPVYNPEGDTNHNVYQHNPDNFYQWFHDKPGVNWPAELNLILTYDPISETYVFQDGDFFPIDNQLFGNQTEVHSKNDHNYHFTLELHANFTYIPNDDPTADQYFQILKSDDDLWVFINGTLVIDMGGLHDGRCGRLSFDSNGDAIYHKYEDNANCIPNGQEEIITLGLTPYETYNFDIFFAERHTASSKLQFYTTIKLDTDLTLGDYHLMPISPCIDAGDNAAVPAGIKQDVDSKPRFIDHPTIEPTGGTPAPVDMGAYEYQVGYDPIKVFAGKPKAVPAEEAEVPLSDAAVSGGLLESRTIKWSVIYAPIGGTWTFAPSDDQENPKVYLGVDPTVFEVFDSVDFVLRLEAEDGYSYDKSDVTITVTSSNAKYDLEVDAGGPYSGAVLAEIPLDGTVTTTNPQGGHITTEWSVVSYPSGGGNEIREVEFSDRFAMDTTATFSFPGQYRIKLWADDGLHQDFEVATVDIDGPQNVPPEVEAGSDYIVPQDVALPVTFNPEQWDPDDRPYVNDSDGPKTPPDISWTCISEWGDNTSVEFTPTDNPVYPDIKIDKPGVHMLLLTAYDGLDRRSDMVKIIVHPYPKVEAGNNRAATLTEQADGSYSATVTLSDAWLEEYTIPKDAQLQWVQDPDNPVPVVLTFDDTVENPTITFSAADAGEIDNVKGVYKFTLTADDPDCQYEGSFDFYVDADEGNDLNVGTQGRPFKTIQHAIGAAEDGDVIIVEEGTYDECINISGRNITLRSTDPSNWNTVAATIINAGSSGSVVTFTGTEDEDCVLEGFTITGGSVSSAGEGGGITGNSTLATISHCIIEGNASTNNGGGLLDCDGLISNCKIMNNSAANGEALCDCDGSIKNCLIYSHSNSGAVDNCNGEITNCTIADNATGLNSCSGIITSCIIWGNTTQLSSCTDPTYSCIQGYNGSGEGNILDNPSFVNGTYNLESNSLCIDAGDPAYTVANETDIEGEPRLKWRIDMGADEVKYKDADYYVDGVNGTNDFLGGHTIETAFKTISYAISRASDYDVIQIQPGLYDDSYIGLGGKILTLRGSDPDDWITVEETIIKCSGYDVVVLDHGSMLEGVTIASEYNDNHDNIRSLGGIISKCIIMGDSSANTSGIYASSGDLTVLDSKIFDLSEGVDIPVTNLSNVNIERCRIYNNNTGIMTQTTMGYININNCKIYANTSRGIEINGTPDIEIWNNWIYGNIVGIWLSGNDTASVPTAVIDNNTIVNNSSHGVLEDAGTYPRGEVNSCIVWGNNGGAIDYQVNGVSSVAYSCVQNGSVGTGNIDEDPDFVDPDGADDTAGTEDDDYHLNFSSPCVDSGDPDYIIPPEELDIDGESRADNIRIDMGADEMWDEFDRRTRDSVWIYIQLEGQTGRALYAGGSEATIGDYEGNGGVVYVKLPGDIWRQISPELGEAVMSLCEYKGNLYAGTSKDSSHPQPSVYRWDGGTVWTNVSERSIYGYKIIGLAVCDGALYAANDDGSLYKYNDDGTWDHIKSTPADISSFYAWEGALYFGDDDSDYIYRYEPGGKSIDTVMEFNGSCIYDFEPYDNALYASAFSGESTDGDLPVYRSDIGTEYTWDNYFTIDNVVHYHSWEITAYNGLLYVGAGPLLFTHDGEENNYSTTEWSVPDLSPNSYSYGHIMSMVEYDNCLIIGTGRTYYWGGIGDVYARVFNYNGSTFTDISEGIYDDTTDQSRSSGIQYLIEFMAPTIPSDLTLAVNPVFEGSGDAIVSPVDEGDDQITYNLVYNSTGQSNADDVLLVTHLPDAVTFVSASHEGTYNPDTHAVIWYVGNISNGDNSADPFVVVVRVNNLALPGSKIITLCSIGNNHWFLPVTDETPEVGCWSGDIVYVSQDGSGHNGASWETAFTDLASALTYVADSSCSYDQIWVAKGTYPAGATLSLVEDMELYGGFAGTESSLDERDLSNPANQTILQGLVNVRFNSYVITADYTINDGIDETVLDGFTIDGGKLGGILCEDTSPLITNCKIIQSTGVGIVCKGSAAPIIADNWIAGNVSDGILLDSCAGTVTIRNNTICDNGYGDNGGYGINCDNSASPTVTSCIIWNNVTGPLDGCSAFWSCFNGSDGSNNNIGDDPDFIAYSLGDYHLTVNSPCIDKGDTTYNPVNSETDIDGEQRVVGDYVDIGADEMPPVRVYAGKDRVVALSTDTAQVSVTLSDADLTIIDDSIAIGDITLTWYQLDTGAPELVNFAPPENTMSPTIIFNQIGTYAFLLEADDDGMIKGRDIVVIRVNLGITLTSDPATVSWPDTTTLTASFIGGTPDHIEWRGPENEAVTFGPADPPNEYETEVTFNEGPAKYEIALGAFDTYNRLIGEQSIWIPVNHASISVTAVATPESVTLPENRIYFNGSVGGGVPHSTTWEVGEEAVEHVTINDAGSLQTWIEFDKPGEYQVALVARDAWDDVIGVDVITVTVNYPNYSDLIVDAGSDQEITLPRNYTFLSGSVTGEIVGIESCEWTSEVKGTLVTFDPDDSLATKVTFGEAGIYTLGLLVKDDDVVVGVDSVTVTVNHPQIEVEAGESQETVLGATIELSGIVTGAGWDSVEWIDPSEEGYVTFGDGTLEDRQKLQTTATFAAIGEYHLMLIAKNASGQVLAADTVVVTVGNVLIDGGPDREITLSGFISQNIVSLQGDIIAGTPDAIRWMLPTDDGGSVVSGIISYGDLNELHSWVQFSQPGVYILGLAALDGGNKIIGWDTVTITVNPATPQDISVDLTSDKYEIIMTGDPANDTVALTGVITTAGTVSSVEWNGPAKSASRCEIFNELDLGDGSYTAEVKFHAPGTYQFGLTVCDDNGGVGFDIVEIKVVQWIQVPVEISYDSEVTLSGGTVTVNLEGEILTGENLYLEWICTAESGFDRIDNNSGVTNLLQSEAVFISAGNYIINFIVRKESGGEIIGILTARIKVHPENYQPFEVDAGVDQEVTLTAGGQITVDLAGTVTGASSPTYQWVAPSGVSVTFDDGIPGNGDDDKKLATKVTLTEPRVYQLFLVVTDGSAVVSDSVLIKVKGITSENSYVDAGEDQQINLLVTNEVDLSGVIRNCIYDNVLWVSPQDEAENDLVTFTSETDGQTTAQFDRPGVYSIAFQARYGEQIMDWDTVQITVDLPQIVVDAKVNDQDEYWASGSSASSLQLSGSVDGIGNPAALTYEWRDMGQTGNVTIENNDPANPDAEVSISDAGHYVLRLEASYDSEVLGWDEVDIILSTGAPSVKVGDYDPIVIFSVDEQPSLDLDQVEIWDDKDVYLTGISWSADKAGVIIDTSSDKQHPTITLPGRNSYTLTLEYTDEDGLSASASTTIVVDFPTEYVNAGEDKKAIINHTVYLNDVKVLPPYSCLEYDWSVVAPFPEGYSADNVEIYGGDWLYPEIVFYAPGEYHLQLTVDYGPDYGDALFGTDTVDITVEEYILPDDGPPTVSLAITTGDFEGEPGSTSISGAVCDDVYILATTEDEHLVNAYLKLTPAGGTEISLPAECTLVQGSTQNPQILELRYKLDSHSLSNSVSIGSPHSLKVVAWDKANKSSQSSASFDTNCNIANFMVNPLTATTSEPQLAFTAESTVSCTLSILDKDSQTVGIPDRTGLTGSISEGYDFSDFPTLSDGVYIARLAEEGGGEIAELNFYVAMGNTGLEAEFTCKPVLEENMGIEIPTNSNGTLFRVDSQKCSDLTATARHSDFPDDVFVKLEVYDASITNYENTVRYDDQGKVVEYLYDNWYYYYPQKMLIDVTPGVPDEEGFVRMSLNNESIGEVDFSGLENGIYKLLLTVICRPGDGEEMVKYDHLDFVLECPLKLGNVKFSQEDLTVNVGGYPLSVVRSYDSQRRFIEGEFAHGWSYSLTNMDIKLNETRSSNGTRIGGDFDRDVTLTLPSDGRRVTFSCVMNSASYPDGDNTAQYNVTYESPPGVNATLSVAEFDVSGERGITKLYGQFDTFSGKGWYWNNYPPYIYGSILGYQVPGVNLSYYDFAGFDLTLEDGTVYHIKREDLGERAVNWMSGNGNLYSYPVYGKPYLQSISLPTQETIWFDVEINADGKPVTKGVKYYPSGTDPQVSPDGYTKSLYFMFDDRGYITEVYPPSELDEITREPVEGVSVPYVKYDYDYVNGNLKEVHKLVDIGDEQFGDEEYETIKYIYEDNFYVPSNHYVTEIQDPRGLAPIRYVYDETGKLVATIDAKNNRIEINHDMTNNSEIVTDRSDNVTIYQYNDRGNVEYIKKLNKAGDVVQETIYEYNDTNYSDGPSRVLVPLVANHSSDDDYSITVARYDTEGRQVLTIDPVLNATETEYDADGNLSKTIQWRPDGASPSFPAGYPGSGIPTDYVEVSTNRNYYDSRNQLIASCVTTGPEASPTIHSMNLNYYNETTNQLEHTVQLKVGTGFVTALNEVLICNSTTGRYDELIDFGSLPYSGHHIVTSYVYDAVKSNSSDQPYKIIDPSGTERFFYYDDNGRQKYSWYEWDDPADGNTDTDKWVYSFNDVDAQGRSIRTRRVVDVDNDLNNGNETETILGQTVYNSIGKVDISEDQHGNKTIYDYDELGNLVETRTYDPSYNLLTVSQTLYDADGRVLVSVGPYDPTDTTTPNYPVGTETVYDALGRVVETRRWASVSIDMVDLKVNDVTVGRTVNPDATVANAWDGSSAQPSNIGWTAGGEGVLPEIGNELSYTRTIYDIAGRVAMSITLDEDGKEQPTSYEYDLAGKQTAIIDPLGHNITYTADGKTIELVTLNGTHRTETHYEGTRRDYVTDANGNITSFEYDDLGRLVITTLPATLQNPETFLHVGYDGLGRKEWQSEQTAQGTAGSLTEAEIKQFEYDVAGRLINLTMPKPKDGDSVIVYDYFYDAYGNQVGILDDKNQLSVFKYNELNQQIAEYMSFVPSGVVNDADDVYYELATALGETNPPAVETRQYDNFSRLVKVITYDEKTTLYKYNSLGQMELESYHAIDPSPGLEPYDPGFYPDPVTLTDYVSMTFDKLGRKEEVHQYEGGAEVHYEIFTYDAEGRVVLITTPDNSIGYGYYAVTGRKMLTRTPAVGDLNDPLDHTDAMTQTSYTYDALGRLKTVSEDRRDDSTTGLPRVTTYNYDEVGNRDDMILPNGITTNYDYDTLNRLTDVSHDSTLNLATYDYTLVADGMRTNISEAIMSVGGTLPDHMDNYTRLYDYDNLNRLTDESSTEDGTSTNGFTAEYDYDSVGNRTLRTITIMKAGETDKTLTHDYDYDDPSTSADDGKDRLWKEIITDSTLAWVPENGYPVYVADSGTSGGYKLSWRPIPSKLWKIGLYASFALVPMLLFTPLMGKFRRKEKKRGKKTLRRGITYLLAFLFLVGPFELQVMADNANLYDNLQTADWSNGATEIVYEYYDTGALKSKTVSGTDPHTVNYEYDFRNRLSKVIETRGDVDEITEYTYNYAGIRVKSHSWTDGQSDDVYTTYLIDPFNHTGYAQVLEEIVDDGTVTRTTYTIGDDVISQIKDEVVSYLLYDGQGSTRQLSDLSGAITDCYSYDGYGMMLGGNPTSASPAATNLLYTGEQYDTSAQQYYLRARYYNPSNGRFNRIDPYSGNMQDPQSLHKYLYCHANPVNNIDPAGEYSLAQFQVSLAIGSLIMTMVSAPTIGYFAFKGASGDEDGWPDAIVITLSGGFASFSLSIALTFHVVIKLSQPFDVYVIPELEGGTAPIAYSKSQSGLAFVGSIGGVWNMKSINDLTGFGFSTTIPFAAFKYGSILFGSNSSRQAIMDFLVNFATVQRSYAKNKPTRFVVQISRSAKSGASTFQVGQASTGFAFGSTVGFGITAFSGRAAGDRLGDELGNKIGQLYSIFGDIKQGSDKSVLNDRFRQVYELFEME